MPGLAPADLAAAELAAKRSFLPWSIPSLPCCSVVPRTLTSTYQTHGATTRCCSRRRQEGLHVLGLPPQELGARRRPASASLQVVAAGVNRAERGREGTSDHAPVWAELRAAAAKRAKRLLPRQYKRRSKQRPAGAPTSPKCQQQKPLPASSSRATTPSAISRRPPNRLARCRRALRKATRAWCSSSRSTGPPQRDRTRRCADRELDLHAVALDRFSSSSGSWVRFASTIRASMHSDTVSVIMQPPPALSRPPVRLSLRDSSRSVQTAPAAVANGASGTLLTGPRRSASPAQAASRRRS